MRRLCALFAALGLALPAAAEEKTGEAKPASRPAPTVAAVVNGVLITEFDILTPYLEQVVQAATPKEKEDKIAEIRRTRLLRAVEMEVFYQEALRAGVSVPQIFLKREMEKQVRKAGGLLTFVRKLQQMRTSYAEYLKQLRRSLTTQIYLQRLLRSHSKTKFATQDVQNLIIAPREMREYYQDHREDFSRVEEGYVRVIVLYSSDFASVAEAEALARTLHRRALGGEDFAAMAAEHSAVRKAERGKIMLKDLKPELAKKTKDLSEGGVSDVIRLLNAFYIVKLEKKPRTVYASFEEAYDDIKNRIAMKYRRREQRLLMQRLLQRTSILPENLKKELVKS
jgi:parvulin-like peptidyl-prolyl isomerase